MSKRQMVLISLILLFALLSCESKKAIYKKTRILMDTVVSISVVSEDKGKAERAIDNAFAELEKLDRLFSIFNPYSEASKINRSAGTEAVSVSDETLELLKRAKEVSDLTEGAFDITVGVVSSMYDFRKGIVPDEEEIKKRLPLISYKDIIIKDRTVKLKKKGMFIDTGGIAKGFAADKAIEVLKKEGTEAALVAVAGDIRAYGIKPDGSAWKVGIRDPRSKDPNEIYAVLELRDGAVSTSGDYERYFIRNGIRYHHIINPFTGRPARGLISVTVIAPLATYTDPLATAVFIMGKDRGMKLIDSLGYAVVMVNEKRNIIMNDKAKRIVRVIKKIGQ